MNKPQAPPKRFNLYHLYCDDEKNNHLPEQHLADIRKVLLMIYQKKYDSK